eukprot:Rhum_TRINITY_DN7714_c0_g1::Rhum_TRINITY_DN7714_c0_g1_i1::g.24367::m.24367
MPQPRHYTYTGSRGPTHPSTHGPSGRTSYARPGAGGGRPDGDSLSKAKFIVDRFRQNKERLSKLEQQVMVLSRENNGLVHYLQDKTAGDASRRDQANSEIIRLQSEKNDLEAALAGERRAAVAPVSSHVGVKRESQAQRRAHRAELSEMRGENQRLRRECHQWRMKMMETQPPSDLGFGGHSSGGSEGSLRDELLATVREKQALERDMREVLRHLEGVKRQGQGNARQKEELLMQIATLNQQLHDSQFQTTQNAQHYRAILEEVKREAEQAIKDAQNRCASFIGMIPGAKQLATLTHQTDEMMQQMAADLEAANRELALLKGSSVSHYNQRPSPRRSAAGLFPSTGTGLQSMHPHADDVVYATDRPGLSPRVPSPQGGGRGGGGGGGGSAAAVQRMVSGGYPARQASQPAASSVGGASIRSDRSRRTFL